MINIIKLQIRDMKRLSIFLLLITLTTVISSQYLGLRLARAEFIYNISKSSFSPLINLYKMVGVDIDQYTLYESKGDVIEFSNALTLAINNNDLQSTQNLLNLGASPQKSNPYTNVSPFGLLVAKTLIGDLIKSEVIELPLIGKQLHNELKSITNTKILNQVQQITLPAIIKNIETQQNCSDGFNAAIIPYKKQYISAYRFNCSLTNYIKRSDYLGLMLLDKEMLPQAKTGSILSNQLRGVDKANRPWDPRLFEYKNKLYMLFDMATNLRARSDVSPHKQSRTMFLAEIGRDKSQGFYIKEYKRLFAPYPESKMEKNWSPLIHNDTLYFVYSLYPEIVVLKPNLATGECVEFSRTNNTIYLPQYGNLRGGTQFMAVADNRYLAFPHITMQMSKIPHRRSYFMHSIILGFEENKFYAKHISNTPILSSVIPQQHDNHTSVTFPTTGYEENGEYKVTIRVNNQDTYLLSIDKNKLLNQLGYDA